MHGTELMLVYRTDLGLAYRGDARTLLESDQGVEPESVDLIITSPPFALTLPKDYGNKTQQEYVEWFESFIPGFVRSLAPSGSLVIDIGGSWLRGAPRRSTYHFELAVMLGRHLELCQEFYWYNPARLPSPAEWVNRRRVRVKDSVNLILWFAKDAANTKADNRRVLKRYSASMQSLLKNGYQACRRPSNHQISMSFVADNGGAIPSNVLGFCREECSSCPCLEGAPFESMFESILAISNTASTDHYLRECRRLGIKSHPARFPIGLPSFFIEFLTEPGDLVCDPFAGSNTTGEAAEAMGRRWVSTDLDAEGGCAGTYVRTSAFRFPNAAISPYFSELPSANWSRGQVHSVRPRPVTERLLPHSEPIDCNPVGDARS